MDMFFQLVINGLAVGCIYGLVALGFVLIYKAGEVVNFAQGELMMLGAFVAFTLIVDFNLNYWLGLALAVLAMAAFGWLLDSVVVRRIIGQPQFSTVMLTIGLGVMMRSGVSIVWGPETRSLSTPFDQMVFQVSGVMISPIYLSILITTVVLCAILALFFRFTRIGLAMQAASQNQLAAYCLGIRVKRVLSSVWALSAGVATIAGVLLAPISLIDVNMGAIGLKAFAAAVIGGFGSITGALLGGVLIGLIELFSAVYLPEGFKNVAAYVVLLAVLVVRPQGLFGTVGRKKV
ncbi:branched-chain amino acid ABC transporter permease [Nitratireductor alexandrii]|uniref:branched-chain amino acid ABC transporter permease n=1 Tax=Nitratireductor alexandrii TaxID=2448161 RepID=UPI000FD77D0A|nr:branched-chain amino acid ABC transporter permease [Nitratireductor alexandrii]